VKLKDSVVYQITGHNFGQFNANRATQLRQLATLHSVPENIASIDFVGRVNGHAAQ